MQPGDTLNLEVTPSVGYAFQPGIEVHADPTLTPSADYVFIKSGDVITESEFKSAIALN